MLLHSVRFTTLAPGSDHGDGSPHGPLTGSAPGRGQITQIGLTGACTTLPGTGEWRNGRRAGLRSRCRVSGVGTRSTPSTLAYQRDSGRDDSRGSATRLGRADRAAGPTGTPPYTSRSMQITRTPAANSTVQLQIELPPDRLDRAVDAAVRALARRTRIPGFRPGKAPRPVLERHLGPGVVLDEAVEHLMQDAYREALIKEDILPLDQRRRRGRPGRGGQAADLQGDRPGPAGGHAR